MKGPALAVKAIRCNEVAAMHLDLLHWMSDYVCLGVSESQDDGWKCVQILDSSKRRISETVCREGESARKSERRTEIVLSPRRRMVASLIPSLPR